MKNNKQYLTLTRNFETKRQKDKTRQDQFVGGKNNQTPVKKKSSTERGDYTVLQAPRQWIQEARGANPAKNDRRSIRSLHLEQPHLSALHSFPLELSGDQ